MPELFRSPLADFHSSRGAVLGEYRGSLVPERFTDTASEHRSTRQAVGLSDFSFRSRFIMRGADRARFLQRIISNDVKNLVAGQGTYATLLTPQGHIVADFRIYCTEDAFLFDVDADIREKTINGLKRYVIADKVTVEPTPIGALSVQGPRAREALEGALGRELPPLPQYGHAATEFTGTAVRVIHASSTGEDGFEIWTEPAGLQGLWTAFMERAGATGLVPCGAAALESLRIEAGIPRYGADFGEDTLPLEAGLLNALSFNKGCYIGQEIVERARSRGHVNWKLVGLVIESPTPPVSGEKLLADAKEVGEITSACVSPTLSKMIALAYVRREFSEVGSRLILANGGPAEVVPLPFYRAREGFCG
ncbi:MAG TPA: aminomethyltransferase family protein [Terriglobia bacterium]|nr:aminomethyltransferase family protein [Terriglobia bacterium]